MTSPERARVGRDVDRALEILRAGGLVAIPTETVYGLAADAEQPDAVRRIFTVKGRPPEHPLIVHVASLEAARSWTEGFPASAELLAEACWPGPLTVLVPRSARVPDVVTGGRPTVGLRVPAHPLTHELLVRFGGALAAPSANRFGRVSPTTAQHVLADLGDEVDYILDGGPCPVGVESTIVDCTVTPAQVLRPGGIPTEDVERLLGALAAPSGDRRAPGMLDAHYAPRCRVVLAESPEAAAALAGAERLGDRQVVVIDQCDDLVAYAQQLYRWLREADDQGASAVVAVLPPAEGLGHAIRDRLAKAAAAGR
jgi:L-threonylcarbamoyladenylate synthase